MTGVDPLYLGLKNDTLDQWSERLLLRLMDQPMYLSHMVDYQKTEDGAEIVFDAIPPEYIEPLREVIGQDDEIEFFQFERNGKSVTGVKVKPKGTREEEPSTKQDAVAPEAKEQSIPEKVVEHLINETVEIKGPGGDVNFFSAIYLLSNGLGRDGQGGDEYFESAEEAAQCLSESCARYGYILNLDSACFEGVRGRQTLDAGEAGQVVLTWFTNEHGCRVRAKHQKQAAGV